MPTSDGISDHDWNEVQNLAANIADATCQNQISESEYPTRAMLELLNTLETKYGRLPSILATRADYVGDVAECVHLLKEAWQIANERHDLRNRTLIAASLAEIFIEELRDRSAGEYWLANLEDAIGEAWDDSEYSGVISLRQKLELL